MPDILEINSAVQEYVFGAEVMLSVYEWIGEKDIVACPRVLVRVKRDDIYHQAHMDFNPSGWAVVTPEFIGKWFRDQFESILL